MNRPRIVGNQDGSHEGYRDVLAPVLGRFMPTSASR